MNETVIPCHGSDHGKFVSATGFSKIVPVYANRTRPPWNTFFDFVLKPDSTGYIRYVYTFGSIEGTIHGKPFKDNTIQTILHNFEHTTLSNAFDGIISGIYEINGSNMILGTPRQPSDLIVTSHVLSNVTDNSIFIVYTINSTHSSEEKTYFVPIVATCPGELVTIGSNSYKGSLPWDSGTVY